MHGRCLLRNEEQQGERTLDANDRGDFTNPRLPMFTFTKKKYLPCINIVILDVLLLATEPIL